MQKYKLSIILAVMTLSIFALLVMTGSVSAQSTPWQINGNNVYYTNGKVGIGTRAPVDKLDVNGNVRIRGQENVAGSGGEINFTSFGRNNLGPRIESNLSYAAGTNSKASLTLSSYWEGYKNEITLRNGLVDVNGNLKLRNNVNAAGAGADLKFSVYGGADFGPRIRSSLTYAATAGNSKSALVLGSYWNGYKDELTLKNGNVGINKSNPAYTLTVDGSACIGNC